MLDFADLAKKLGLILTGVIASLLLLEGSVRAIRPNLTPEDEFIQPDERFGWFHIPRWEGTIVRRTTRTLFTTNSRGLRDREITFEKEEGVFRILFLGDSMTEGLGVPVESTFVKIVESLLNDAELREGSRFEVVNAGVVGWGTDQELLFFREEGREYDPDLVLLAFSSGTDVAENSYLLRRGWPKPFFFLDGGELTRIPFQLKTTAVSDADVTDSTAAGVTRSLSPFLSMKVLLERHSKSYVMLREAMITSAPSVAQRLMSLGIMGQRPVGHQRLLQLGTPRRYMVFSNHYNSDWHDAWEITRALITQIRDESDEARFGVVVLSTPEQSSPDRVALALESFPAMKREQWNWEKPDSILADFFQSEQISYLPLLAHFREYIRDRGKDPYIGEDVHFNEKGHRLAATAIFDWLVSESLIEN